jgi:hypothetical protein
MFRGEHSRPGSGERRPAAQRAQGGRTICRIPDLDSLKEPADPPLSGEPPETTAGPAVLPQNTSTSMLIHRLACSDPHEDAVQTRK